MNLVYGTNIWSHYQEPIGIELARILGPDKFRLALFEKVHAERNALGWGQEGSYPWIIGPPSDAQDRARLFQQCLDADVMIFGHCPRELLQARVEAKKLTLVASERLLKKPFHNLRKLDPRYSLWLSRYRNLVNHPHIHAFAIGHYAPGDLQTIGAFGDRIWNWGYFADVSPTPPLSSPDRPLKILWVGRLLSWKRVDTLLRAVACFANSASLGECLIVGDGPEKMRLHRLARRLQLDPKKVRFLPPVSFAEVRQLMHEADVYVMPSDRHEGWGVVLGEAISEGCVVIANEQAGATLELISHNKTGLVFRNGDHRQLANFLEILAQNHKHRMRIRQEAWKHVQELWCPKVAAERLVELCRGLLDGKPPSYPEGPCCKVY